MSRIKRLRIFAGPNGSGKSVLYDYLVKTHYFNPYFHINSDLISAELKTGLNLTNWPIKLDEDVLFTFLDKSSFSEHVESQKLRDMVSFDGATIILNNPENVDSVSYLSAAIADFIRRQMLVSDSSFSVETVFSHPSKLEFMHEAHEAGFRMYLYFIATANPLINIQRVQSRISAGGHFVPESKISARYYRTMENLFDAVLIADRVFLFDNSESLQVNSYTEFAQKKDDILHILGDEQPSWFQKYVIDKIR